ncbi:Tfp pilus assembly protein FimT/FimU [Planctomycetota bacterium]
MMMLQIMMNPQIKNKYRTDCSKGFTLFELIIVLAIISAMTCVIIPFASRSNNSLKVTEHSRDIAQTIRFAIDLAQSTYSPIKFVIETKSKCYYLQQSDQSSNFEPLKSYLGSPRYFDKRIHIVDTEGMDADSKGFSLIFDPGKPWPKASFTLSTTDVEKTIKINAKGVQIEEASI